MEQKLNKILFITNIPAPYRIDFYNELGQNCDLTVIFEAKRAPGITFNWKEDAIKNFKAIFLKEGEIEEKRVDWSIFRHLRNLNYDKIFITNYAYLTETVAILSIKLRGIKYYYELDGAMAKQNEGAIRKSIKSFFLKGAKAYISPSGVTDDYIKFYCGAKVKIYRYPFSSLSDVDILHKPLEQEEKLNIRQRLCIEEPKMVLAVGQFIHRKGFDVLMTAASSMDRNIGIYIVGGKPTEEYKDLQKKYDLKQVHFEGFKTKEELAEYFKAADVFVHPTREDIWGLVINEAMAYGLPVITTNKCVAGIELIDDKECIIDTDAPEQLKNVIMKILDDNLYRDMLATKNLKRIKGYTVEKMAEAHMRIFNQI